jgi:hypothetical protein
LRERWTKAEDGDRDDNEDLGYAADEVLGIGAARYSIFDLIIFTP